MEKKHCAGCKECLDSAATTGEQCVEMRDCKCHQYPRNILTDITLDKLNELENDGVVITYFSPPKIK